MPDLIDTVHAAAPADAPTTATPRPPDRLRALVRGALGSTAYAAARSVYRLGRGRELRAPYPMREKLAAWMRGFRASSAALYDLERNDPRDYVSDYVRRVHLGTLNPARAFLDNKLMMRLLLLAKGLRQAETVAVVSAGDVQLFPLEREARALSAAEFERWLLEAGGRYIVKPQDGRRGADVFLLTASDGVLLRHKGRESRPFRVGDLRGVTLVERVIEQGEFWRALSPHSTNTMRVLSLWTPGDREPFVGAAVQRMGTVDTAPTDNWSGGGICARIDLATGRLGIGRMHPAKGKRGQTEFTHHPDTGAAIEGAVVPHWERIRETVLAAAASSVTHRYVGWDVAVDADGVPVIIEGNNNTDLDLLQVHGGLLADPAVRRFFERIGAL